MSRKTIVRQRRALDARKKARGSRRYRKGSLQLRSTFLDGGSSICLSIRKQFRDIRALFALKARSALRTKLVSIAAEENNTLQRLLDCTVQMREAVDPERLNALFRSIERINNLEDKYTFSENKNTLAVKKIFDEFRKSNRDRFDLERMHLSDVDNNLPLKILFNYEFNLYLKNHHEYKAERIRKTRYLNKISKLRQSLLAQVNSSKTEIDALNTQMKLLKQRLGELRSEREAATFRKFPVAIRASKAWIFSRKRFSFMSFGFGSFFSLSFLSVCSIDVPKTSINPISTSPDYVIEHVVVEPRVKEVAQEASVPSGIQLFPDNGLPVHWVENSDLEVIEGLSAHPQALDAVSVPKGLCLEEHLIIVGAASQSGADAINQSIARRRSVRTSNWIYRNCQREQTHILLALRSPSFARNDGVQRKMRVFNIRHTSSDILERSDVGSIIKELIEEQRLGYDSQEFVILSNLANMPLNLHWAQIASDH